MWRTRPNKLEEIGDRISGSDIESRAEVISTCGVVGSPKELNVLQIVICVEGGGNNGNGSRDVCGCSCEYLIVGWGDDLDAGRRLVGKRITGTRTPICKQEIWVLA